MHASNPLRIEAKTLPELFESVAQAVFAQFIEPSEVGQALREKIAIEAKNEEGLLSEWVVMLLELLRYNHMAASQFKIDLQMEANAPLSLKSEVLGELIDVQRHVLKRDPALARSENVSLKKIGDKYIAEIVLLENL